MKEWRRSEQTRKRRKQSTETKAKKQHEAVERPAGEKPWRPPQGDGQGEPPTPTPKLSAQDSTKETTEPTHRRHSHCRRTKTPTNDSAQSRMDGNTIQVDSRWKESWHTPAPRNEKEEPPPMRSGIAVQPQGEGCTAEEAPTEAKPGASNEARRADQARDITLPKGSDPRRDASGHSQQTTQAAAQEHNPHT